VRWRTSLWVLATTAALAPASLVLAGRAGFRAEYGPTGFSLRGYLEETLARLGPIEVTAGLDLRLPEVEATPYTAAIYEGAWYWLAVEVAKPVPGDPGAFRFAVMGGWEW